MAYISVDSTTANSVTVHVSGLDTNWNQGYRIMTWYLAENSMPTETAYDIKTIGNLIENGAAQSKSITIMNLEPDTEYGVLCTVYFGDTFLASAEGWVTTDAPGNEPIEYFGWSYEAVQAFKHSGATTELTASEWNAFIDKISEVSSAAGYGPWLTYNGIDKNAAKALGAYDDAENLRYYITAQRFNAAKYNIGSKVSTGISDVKKGDTAKGEYFNTLELCLNKWIDIVNIGR